MHMDEEEFGSSVIGVVLWILQSARGPSEPRPTARGMMVCPLSLLRERVAASSQIGRAHV
jgi:hypothetical protein